MKTFLKFCAITLAVAIVKAEDVLKVEDAEIIQNEKLFKEFYACMMDQNPCPDKMKTLREIIPKYAGTNCSDCSPKEKEMFEKYNKMIFEKYPKEYKDLIDKFGPKAE